MSCKFVSCMSKREHASIQNLVIVPRAPNKSPITSKFVTQYFSESNYYKADKFPFFSHLNLRGGSQGELSEEVVT